MGSRSERWEMKPTKTCRARSQDPIVLSFEFDANPVDFHPDKLRLPEPLLGGPIRLAPGLLMCDGELFTNPR